MLEEGPCGHQAQPGRMHAERAHMHPWRRRRAQTWCDGSNFAGDADGVGLLVAQVLSTWHQVQLKKRLEGVTKPAAATAVWLSELGELATSALTTMLSGTKHASTLVSQLIPEKPGSHPHV